MKKILSLIAVVGICFVSFAQQPTYNSSKVIKAEDFRITPPLRDIEPEAPSINDAKIIRNKLRRSKHITDGLPFGHDEIWQQEMGRTPSRGLEENFDGISNVSAPPDPSGAVGPNHYIQMVNVAYQIFNKQGTSLYGPASLSSIWSGSVNEGDPIVMYDKFADRWFLSQFQQNGNKILIAISQTNDPLGSYYTYSFSLTNFPDYPKYSIWADGYYMSANENGNDNAVVVFERDKMLTGDQGAQAIEITVPNLTQGGFFSLAPADVDGNTLPTVGTPNYMFYFNDDGWGSGTDAVKVWEIDVDWTTPSNTSMTLTKTIPVTAFDSEFTAQWNDIQQPGTSQKVDAIPGAMMYRAQFRNWDSYNTVVLNHTVDVDATNHAGIRWYELRDANDGNWTLHQEGTYAPDAESRWCGSISMDKQGNIGLAYSVSGPTVFPSLRYTGRLANDPLGEMTITETSIIEGNGIQDDWSLGNRWGDYAHMTVDPNDDLTFWYTGQYIPSDNVKKTRITAFKIGNDYDNDIAAVTLNSPTDGQLTNSESIDITIFNLGVNSQSNFSVGYQIGNNTPVVETYAGTIAGQGSGTYTFTQTADLSNEGLYDFKIFSALATDQDTNNDTAFVEVEHTSQFNVGVTAINSPSSGTGLTNSETIQVTIKNFGYSTASNFPVKYIIDGGTPVTATYTSSILSGATATYSFTQTGDFSALGNHTLVAYTDMTNDANRSNDTTSTAITNEVCAPEANCGWGDGFRSFKLNTINNNSGCDPNGYGDYTNLITDLYADSTYDLSVTSQYTEQYLTVWIDYNDNYNFEASEMIIQNAIFNYNTTQTVTMPTNPATGNHLLRARINYQANSDEPCVDFDYGETEDYMVNVIDPTPSNIKELYNNNSFDLYYNNETFTLRNLNADNTLEVYNSIGQVVFTTKTNSNTLSINAHDWQRGSYLFVLKSENGNSIRKAMK